MITMTEIARMVHVSQPTVSRVLNGSKTVDPDIRERVLACAREHDYQPSALAKGLRGSRTNLLGVLVTDISNSFFADLSREIETRASMYGYSIILFNTDLNPVKQRDCLDVLRRYRVDGVIMVPSVDNSALWQECLNKLSQPTVMITWHVKGYDSVYVDHEEAAGMVASHLAQRGYERFLFVGRPTDIKYRSFCRRLEELGLCRGEETESLSCEDSDTLRTLLERWLGRGSGRAGIFATNDLHALRVLRALGELKVEVPRQAGVIGFDNTSMCRYLQPSLSSVSQPIARMAEKAVDQLVCRIEHPGEPEILECSFHGELVPREST